MYTQINKSNVINEINNILKNLFGFDITGFGEGYENEQLLSNKIQLIASDLVYIFLEVERCFGIKIPQEDIVEGKFDTINNISEVIIKQLETKEKKKVV